MANGAERNVCCAGKSVVVESWAHRLVCADVVRCPDWKTEIFDTCSAGKSSSSLPACCKIVRQYPQGGVSSHDSTNSNVVFGDGFRGDEELVPPRLSYFVYFTHTSIAHVAFLLTLEYPFLKPHIPHVGSFSLPSSTIRQFTTLQIE